MNAEERKHFLSERRKGIGASDIAGIMGLSRWKTAAIVCADKLGLLPEVPQNEEQRIGSKIEPFLAEMFTARTGKNAVRPNAVRIDPECSYIRSNLDFETDGNIPLEAKNTGRVWYKGADGNEYRWGPDGTDDVPVEYLCQVQTQMAAVKADHGYIAVLIGGCDFRVYKILRSEKIIDAIRTEAERFWSEHVQTRNLPPHDWKHPRTAEFVATLAKATPGTRVTLPAGDRVHELVRRYKLLREFHALAERHSKQVKAEILAQLGDVAEVDFADGSTLTRKQINRAGYMVKPTSYEDFRVNWKGAPFLLTIPGSGMATQTALPESTED